jgi:hypothetical protein
MQAAHILRSQFNMQVQHDCHMMSVSYGRERVGAHPKQYSTSMGYMITFPYHARSRAAADDHVTQVTRRSDREPPQRLTPHYSTSLLQQRTYSTPNPAVRSLWSAAMNWLVVCQKPLRAAERAEWGAGDGGVSVCQLDTTSNTDERWRALFWCHPISVGRLWDRDVSLVTSVVCRVVRSAYIK